MLALPYYRSVGEVPRKRHTLARGAGVDGYLAEELIGQEGFAQESALLYHLGSPSAVADITAVEGSDVREVEPDRPLTPRHLRTPELEVRR